MAIVNTRYGLMHAIDSDSVVSRSLKLYGEWAQIEIDLLVQLVKPGDCVIDVGAFIGTHTVALAKAVGEDGKVYSFEPRREIFAILSENVGLNNFDNVEFFNLGLSDASATVQLEPLNLESGENFGGLALVGQSADKGASTYEVSVTTLDSLALTKVQLIKLDVEGMEGKVIQGARETIARSRPLIFTECNSVAGGAEIMQICNELDYSAFGCLSAAYNPKNFNRALENIFSDAMELGLLLIPHEKKADFVSYITAQNLLEVSDYDDLTLLLMHKPQYVLDILAGSIIGKRLGTDFKTPLSRKTQDLLIDCQNALASIDELARVRLKEIENLTERISLTDKGLDEAQRLAFNRLHEIEQLNSRVIATDLALEQAQRMAFDRLRELEERGSHISRKNLTVGKAPNLPITDTARQDRLPVQFEGSEASSGTDVNEGKKLSNDHFGESGVKPGIPKEPQ